jgi:hypothetical protein
MTRDYSRREFVAGCGGAGAAALLGGTAAANARGQDDAPPTRWNRTYEGENNAVTNAAVPAVDDDGFVFAGARGPDSGDDDRVAWLYKVDGAGELVWEETYSRQSTTVAIDLVATGDGYVLAGNTSGGPDGGQDGFAVSVDAEGASRWQQSFWFAPESEDTVNAIVQRPDDGFVCVGRTARFEDGWVQRLDSDGGVGREDTYSGGDGSTLYGVANHPDGGYFLAGAGSSNTEDLQGWILHINDEGDQVWASSQFYRQRSDSATNPYNDYNAFYDVARADQGFVLVGATAFDPASGQRRGWIMEVNNTGVRQWADRLGTDRRTGHRYAGGNGDVTVPGSSVESVPVMPRQPAVTSRRTPTATRPRRIGSVL